MNKQNRRIDNFFSVQSPRSTESGLVLLLRNKMGDDWMNHRMLCYIDVFVSTKESKIILKLSLTQRHFTSFQKQVFIFFIIHYFTYLCTD
jgi:hypothetical protein